jgi:M6 family metalloprotease-like protein
MIKNLTLLLTVSILFMNYLLAVPAKPQEVLYSQPDGTFVSMMLKGDEKVKWALSVDGYTLLANDKGFYCYATRNAKGDIVPSGIVAHNIGDRNQAELAFVTNLDKSLKYSKEQISMLRAIWDINSKEAEKSFPTTGNRNLVMILIGFTDKAFTKTQNDFNNLMNQVNYSVNGATGSVRDYFYDNSFNQLTLNTIVAGPYTASNTMAYYGANDPYGDDLRPRTLVSEAINKADTDVDFSLTDNDNDGYADGLYVIYAGYGEEAGASANAIWAHAWALSSPVLKDGVYLSEYSCSSELDGSYGTNLTNIGVICHEFSHVCGLPDYYDTDYETSGQSFDLGNWDIMAGGSWNNDGKTPPYHNSYSRMALGWQAVNLLTSAQTISLPNSAENNISYRFNTGTNNEFFIVENRQKIKWDAYIPYHGMLIYHVDLNYSGWNTNDINSVPSHQGMDIEEADNVKTDATVNADPFPGTGSKTSFTDATTPSSKSWANANTSKPITSISEADNVVSFKFMGGNVANPSNLASSNITTKQIQINWNLDASNNNVLLVFNTSNTFGTPATNTTYTAGQTLSGGGIVLQYSAGTSFTHTSLSDGTTYYYKLWSYNGYVYSDGSALSATTVASNIPAGYYSSAEGLCESALKTALYNIIKGHTDLGYDGLYDAYATTDNINVSGQNVVYDIYSFKPNGTADYYFSHSSSDQCGSYNSEGDCYNREHSFPQSWFGSGTPKSDAFQVYPTDGYVNNRRGNSPFGEVSSPTWTSSNGSKVGSCSYPGYSGVVFEPIDEFKGDLARSYFYMATRYENLIASWENNVSEADAVLDGTSFPCFETWFLNMLIEWNNQDPVSQKEITRNDAIYALQHNRNPYIDHPEYVDAVWGAGCSGSNPVVNLSVSSNSASEASATVVTLTVTASAAVSGNQTVSLTVSGAGITTGDYSLGSASITINSGATQGSTTFTVINDVDIEGTETAHIVISNPSSGITPGSTTAQNITIADNDSGGGTGSELTYFEDFDTNENWAGGTAGSYNAKTYTNNSDPANDGFSGNLALKETTAGYTHSGANAWRIKDVANTYFRYEIDKPVKSFGIFAARWDNSPTPNITIRYSTDSGISYTDIETFDGSWFTADKTYKEYTHSFGTPVSPEPGNKIFIEFVTTTGERMIYDDFTVTYIDGTVEIQ